MAKENIPFHILHLNDDCLSEVFKFLDLIDLIELYKVHWRFHNGIQFTVRSPKKEIRLSRDQWLKVEPNSIENFVRKFGQDIACLTIKDCERQTEVEQLINQYCSNGNVQKFSFHSFSISEDFIDNNVNMFKHLKSIILNGIIAGDSEDTLIKLFSMTTAVKDIQIRNMFFIKYYLNSALLTKILPHQLESLTFNNFNENLFNGISIHLNTTVKRVKISSQAIKVLEFLPNIESLDIKIWNRLENHSFQLILNLKNLTTLNVYIQKFNWTNDVGMDLRSFLVMLQKVNALEKLTLHDFRYYNIVETINEIKNSVCKLTKLKRLELHWNFNFAPKISLYLNYKQLRDYLFMDEDFAENISSSLKQLREFYYKNDVLQSRQRIENILSGFVGLTKNLVILTIKIRSIDSEPDEHYYDKLYDKLSLLRQRQNSDEMLVVSIINNCERIEIKKNNWLKLHAGRMRCCFDRVPSEFNIRDI